MDTELAKETEKFRQKTAGLNPNEMVCGIFTIPVRDGENVKIPWFFIKNDAPGKKDSPCIWIQAGLHGDEYDGIVALRKLAEILPSMSLGGDVLLIPVVNVPAYEAQANACPADSVNLNRVFDKKNTGSSFSYLYGMFLLGLIMELADYFVDLHGGGQYLDVTEFVTVPPGASEETRKLAGELKVNYVCRSGMPGMLIDRLTEEGIPSILLERGGGLQCSYSAVEGHMENVLRILRYWGFLTEHGEDGRISRNPHRPVEIEQSEHLYFPQEGILLDHVPVGTVVKRGETLITWASREGTDIYTMACPAEKAVVLSIHTAAKADKGAYAVMLGLL